MILLAWLGFGRLAIYTIQVNGLIRPIFSLHSKLVELRDCDFCLGFWVFSLLAWAFGINLLDPVYIPGLSEVLSGLAASFAVHLIRIGWESQFGVIHLGE